MTCVDEQEFVEAGADRILTQYRESPKLLHLIRTYLRQAHLAAAAICDLPNHFDLDTATGDQLTIIGKWMGFPRCHCVCDVQPVIGFKCEGTTIGARPMVGFCEGGIWLGCETDGLSEICILDDDLYRRLLIARSYQMQANYSWDGLTSAMHALFGEQARIMDTSFGSVILAPFRPLSELEIAVLQVIPRALPVAPGISTRWHLGTFAVAGFGDGWGGFCEPWEMDGLVLSTEAGVSIISDGGEELLTGPLYRDADWLCRIDLKPYSC
ncbi:DUF2612 domain-containing protein [Gellertiella hungarica]|uniref:DUF2612 domain-containing protein n=1 Tax=Gellertiella hungarica TaxID=1572859 RepID=A0A7W6NJW6_9HYPH|nr:DUF2612 domain-containing protein [Gellertiella hungarica]MBB4063697.1 hypothetical protein [Gellertiella hungarica]